MKKPAQNAGNGAAADDASVPRLPCVRCRTEVAPVLSTSGPHLRADCPRCCRYLKFVPRTPAWLEQLELQEDRRIGARVSLFGAPS